RGRLGGAAGVEDEEGVLGVDGGGLVRGGGRGEAALVVVAEDDRVAAERGGVPGRRERRRRRHHTQAMRELGGGEADVLARDDRAEARGGEEQLEHLGAVLRQHRDAIAVAHAERGEDVRHAPRPLVELAVGQRARAVGHGDASGVGARLRGERRRHRALRGPPDGPPVVRLGCLGPAGHRRLRYQTAAVRTRCCYPPAMLFPTTLVGSYPQPDWLIDRARLAGRFPPRVRARELWRVAEPFLAQAQDDATLLAIRAQEEAGLDIITAGEIRRESYSNRFATALDGIDIDHPGTALDRSGHPNPVPRIVGPIRRRRPVVVDDLEFLRAHTRRPVKMTVPGPFTMSQQAQNDFYPTDEAAAMDYAVAV